MVQLIVRLPSTVLVAIAKQGEGDREESSHLAKLSDDDSVQLDAWLGLGRSITRMKDLRKLRIWLDCSESSHWANIDERAVLSDLQPLTRLPSLDFCIDLPRHCEDDKPLHPFTINRRLRQRYYGYTDHRGRLLVSTKFDFPMLEVGLFGFEDLDQAQLEELERKMWRKGVDIEEEILSEPSFFVHTGTI
jgi:hypothetical protein